MDSKKKGGGERNNTRYMGASYDYTMRKLRKRVVLREDEQGSNKRRGKGQGKVLLRLE